MLQLDEIRSKLPALKEQIEEVGGYLDPDGLRKRIRDLEDESLKAGFWDDQRKAQKVLKEKKSLETRLSLSLIHI